MTNIANDITHSIKIAHVTLEYKLGVGGLKSVTTGLIPALCNSNEIDPAVITPFFDIYHDFYKNSDLKKVATVTHIYKGKQFQSDVFRVCSEIINNKPIYHYLIKPINNSAVACIFNIGEEKNIYKSFKHSEVHNRFEYFNGAVAAMLRIPNDNIPEFDIIHTHTWHSGLAGCLVKEFEHLPLYQDIITAANKPLNKIPYVVATIHMLLKGENGSLTSKKSVQSLLESVGLPSNFTYNFTQHHADLNKNHIKQVVIPLLYADYVTFVSKGLENEVINGKAEGLEGLFKELHYNKRLKGITNGINIADWDSQDPKNLQEFVFTDGSIRSSKQRLKIHLASQFPNLDPNKPWFIFIGRLANEKGVEYLPDLWNAVRKVNGNLIILGSHVAYTIIDGKPVPTYKKIIDDLHTTGCVVLDNIESQKLFGKKFRAASDCAVSLSKNEACGLVPMELMMYGAISVAPNIQGLPDTVKELNATNNSGTGILYDGSPENRKQHLEAAIIKAAEFLSLKIKDGSIDVFLQKLISEAKQYDWAAVPAQEYTKLYKEIIKRKLLTTDDIHKKSITAPRIWSIGFNKCGTTTLFRFFSNNGIASIHYGTSRDGALATIMYNNYLQGKPILSPQFEQYKAFFDLENVYADPPIFINLMLFKELDANYPGSKFILNTRNKNDWINSRLAHVDKMKNKRYVDVLCAAYQINEAELIARWSQEWDAYHAEVLEYFKDRPQDLLIFNIDTDKPEKICEFFKDMFTLDPSLYGHHNKTPPKPSLA